METMREWFGLKTNHNDFTIGTDKDAGEFFARAELDVTLDGILRRSFRTSNPPKMVLYGDWGVGKTHTMRHVEYKIEHNDAYKATVVFVEMPDITAKSTFQVAHAALLDALSFEKARRWFLSFQTLHPADANELTLEFTQSGDIAKAFGNLLAGGEGAGIAWEWLRGFPLSNADSRFVGLPGQLTQSTQLVRVLEMLGKLSGEVDGKVLVFMLDEATKLGSVTNQAAVDHWINAMKVIADQQTKEIGFIVSGSWIDADDIALPLQDQQVASRFADQNYILLQNLDEVGTSEFIGSLLGEWIDPPARDALMLRHASESEGETLTESAFPFTEEGKAFTVQYACRRSGYTTPRDIQSTLDDLLNRAIDDNRHIVSGAYLNALISGL